MDKPDLQEEFLRALSSLIPNRVALVNRITDILHIEKDAIYRRLSGKVNFSIREMGMLVKKLGISLDRLMSEDTNSIWVPFNLTHPLALHSMDGLVEIIEYNLDVIKDMVDDELCESGNICNALPIEFFISSPIMMRFMFFKWGHYFIRSEEFHDFSKWKLPSEFIRLSSKYEKLFNHRSTFYIWDRSMIWNLASEIQNFARMFILSYQEKQEIKEGLLDILSKIEQTLNGTYEFNLSLPKDLAFYVSPINIGFTSNYYTSKNKSLATLQTNFSFSQIENSKRDFNKIKDWINGFRHISTLLSESGRIERRIFFENQYKIINDIIK